MSTYYELGRSGRGPSYTCPTEDDLLKIGPFLTPGKYWITRTEIERSADGTEWRESEDWGVLEVGGAEDWKLTSLAGLEAGPGYLLA